MHWACTGDDDTCSSALALLLDAGASINARTSFGSTTPLLCAHEECRRFVAVLIDRGGDALDLDA